VDRRIGGTGPIDLGLRTEYCEGTETDRNDSNPLSGNHRPF